jgi:signal transduction histidine kinase
MLGLMLAVLFAGGLVIVRTVRREMQIAQLKSDFVSTVSHEFRSPLTGIRQLGEMLVRGRVPNDDRRREYYESILRESERLDRLVEGVLDFARMEDGRKQYRFETIETTAWLRQLAAEARTDAERQGYVLHECIDDLLPGVSGDREALASAVRNLIDNAIKYSPGQRDVWLEAHALGPHVRIQVRDCGVGIPVSQQDQIFERFYRADGDLSKRVKGVGLGLTLVRHIVESHGGTIHVDSREGEGSTFSIDLAVP